MPQVIPATEGSEYLFRILPNGSIILNGSLDYNSKSSFYQLELKACVSGGAGGGWGHGDPRPRFMETRLPAGLGRPVQQSHRHPVSSSVFVSISVIDKPDLDPQFVREFYSASVAEDTPQVCWAPGGGPGGS